ncbi:hypothetical protein FH608_040460 [Nonomuraea phyllanthi]|uniref:Uncharacterized protein n=1 Tax=Nonomuraea phyllanthi TaxID=2219224 RepID=A0A5C4VIU2_9ACTN|nr:hypothetical protein [Nonomuraea phyllanthi]KAB8189126.1 hypothetical protein FH608_040460 [Nonomuraea phyllanthi]
MTDIGDQVLSAVSKAAAWGPGAALSTAALLAPSGSVDWDERAGESWVRALDDDEVTALVSIRLPLLLATPDRLAGAALPAEVVAVAVGDLDEPALSCPETALAAAFGEAAVARLDSDAFSATDLWYVTV